MRVELAAPKPENWEEPNESPENWKLTEGKPITGPEVSPFWAAKALASADLSAISLLLARLKPKRNSLTTVGLKMWVSLRATLRALNTTFCGL